MIIAEQIREVLSQYKKHGWNLSRVLLSEPTREKLSDSIETLFGDADIVSFDLDAVWFSRASGDNREVWELRRLSGTPFALLETFDAGTSEKIREQARRKMQTRLLNSASKHANRKFSGES